jgi:DNA-binding transcriptional regulator YiaG
MPRDTVYTRTMHRALETRGSAERLAIELGASVAEVEAWTAGRADPPPGVFLKAIDIVAQAGSLPRRAAKS